MEFLGSHHWLIHRRLSLTTQMTWSWQIVSARDCNWKHFSFWRYIKLSRQIFPWYLATPTVRDFLTFGGWVFFFVNSSPFCLEHCLTKSFSSSSSWIGFFPLTDRFVYYSVWYLEQNIKWPFVYDSSLENYRSCLFLDYSPHHQISYHGKVPSQFE